MSELDRRTELGANLTAVRQRLADAELAAGRPTGSVTLIAVTKTYPASDVRLLAELGVSDVGENRDQEAAAKHAACAELPVRWHFVGQLQGNKVRSVARYADVVQSVDRLELVGLLGRAAVAAQRQLGVCCQLSLADEPAPGRGGVAPELLPALAAAVAGQEGLRLLGLMGVAPLGGDAAAAYARLAVAAAAIRADHPTATMLSAGMSGDLEVAIAAGATHVRVGSALLGRRRTLK